MPSYDAIIIGVGTNGLACAGKLAASGRKVLVLEAGPVVGGGANTVEFAPGFGLSGLAHLHQGLDSRMMAAMKLAQQGLVANDTNVATTALSATGDQVILQGASLSGGPDGDAYMALQKRLMGFANVLAPVSRRDPAAHRQGRWYRLSAAGQAGPWRANARQGRIP